MGTIHAFRSSLATLFLLGHCRYVQRRLERLSWSMLRGRQVLPEGTARLGSRNMKACPTYTCVSWTWGWDCSCAGCCPTAPVTIPMCCGVKSSTGAAARVSVWGSFPSCSSQDASGTWAEPVLGIWTGKRGCRNESSEAGWQNSFGMWSDKHWENSNFLRTNSQLYMWNLLGDLHYLTLLHQPDLRGDSEQSSPPAEELCQNWLGDTSA